MKQNTEIEQITREMMPLTVGNMCELDGEVIEYIDWPTGGPQFELVAEDSPHNQIQLSVAEFTELWNNGDITPLKDA